MKIDSIVGVRNTYFFTESSDSLKANGNIEVLTTHRGKGIASAIEYVHQLVLQQKVDLDPTIDTIKYQVIDANKDRLERLIEKESITDKSSPHYPLILEQLQDAYRQRKSWESLYGANKKLGFLETRGALIKEFRKGTPFDHPGVSIVNIDTPKDIFKLLQSRVTNKQ